ncbi:MAG: GNAT family N-acetyltransferase [Glutamicibacter sp.]|uniref:GNAT family N-acetyltransferase n=2 Tax=Micrococcales TaxID=85006 RepID=UPI000CFBA857|nr:MULTISPECIES: GNAT family N-acetyltransferase [unclassified Arthrobacter]PRB76713.1 GNAT family N-acetyltransferase [Arthrobacter sp. MYb214]TDU30426.1 putative acetyltransferase [Arthrobacter sp. JUb115]
MTGIGLIEPSAALHASFMRSTTEWAGAEQDGASVFYAAKYGWDLRNAEDFAQWVQLLKDLEKPHFTPPDGFVAQSTLWLAHDDEYLGAVSLRHELGNDFLREVGGHIGYGIRPGARGNRLARTALAGSLEQARSLGLPRVLLTCNDSNTASARTIEACGGVLERVTPVAEIGPRFGSTEDLRRYWIELS